jgi:hypothetical protein
VEYVRFLCHRAVLAHRQGDVLEATRQLVLAGWADSGHRFDLREVVADGVAVLNEVFDTAVDEMRSSAARNRAKGAWQPTVQRFDIARTAGDDRRTTLMLAELEDLLELVTRGEI